MVDVALDSLTGNDGRPAAGATAAGATAAGATAGQPSEHGWLSGVFLPAPGVIVGYIS